jgi:hypothetical protein
MVWRPRCIQRPPALSGCGANLFEQRLPAETPPVQCFAAPVDALKSNDGAGYRDQRDHKGHAQRISRLGTLSVQLIITLKTPALLPLEGA